MKSFRRRRYGQAEALIDARNKAFNIVMAVLLVFTMLPVTAFTYESQASAEPLNNEQIDTYSDDGSSSDQGGDKGTSAGSSTGGNNATGGDDGTSGGSSSEPGSGSGGSSDNGSGGGSDDGTGSNSGSGSDDNNTSSGNGNQGDQNGSLNGNGASDEDNNSGSSSNNDGNSDDSGTTDEKDDSNSPEDDANNDSKDPSDSEEGEDQRDPFAWQSKLDACDLDAKLTVETSEIESLENNDLPSTIPATFRVDFNLNPGEDKLLVGDWIETTLPNFLTFENQTYEVFRLNEDGTETTEKIADAKTENGKLKIAFIEAGATEDANAVVRGFVDLKATFSAALLGDGQELKQTWTAQTAEDGTENNVDVVFPTKQAVLDAWRSIHNPLGALGSALGVTNGDVAAQTAEDSINSLSESTTTYSLDNYSGSAAMNITWCDNNSAKRPDMTGYGASIIPEFTLDGGKTWIQLIDKNGSLTTSAREALHIPNGQTPSWVRGVVMSSVSVSTWHAEASGLPTRLNTITTTQDTDEDGNPLFNDDGTPQMSSATETTNIQWRINDTNALSAYYIYGDNDSGAISPTAEGEDGQRYYMLTQEYTFTIKGNIGDDPLEQIFGANFADKEHADDFHFGAMIDNKYVDDPQQFPSIAEMVQSFAERGRKFTVEFSEDGKTATITAVLPMYDVNNSPIVYYIQFQDHHEGPAGQDYFQPSYNNSGSPSHGSSTTLLHDGGTMTLRPMGQTSYDADKVWLDGDNKDNRPATTFSLWRYSTNSSYSQAAQVQLNAVTSGTSNPGSSMNAVEFVTVTIPEKSDSTVDLNKLLREKYGDAIDQLPKYDPDGYPYIYALREDSSLEGYETVYGTVGSDGAVTDTAPNYEDTEGKRVDLSAADRTKDPFIYNGGTITNRLTGTIPVEATKTWEIAAFQDSLKDVTVEFTLQQRLANPGFGQNDEWQNTDNKHEINGWLSEILTQTFSETFPKYDSQGRELEYRWVESNVTLGDQNTNFASDGKGGGTFTLSLENIEGEQEQLNFTSTLDEETNTITNRFDNTTYERVDKFWQQPDGTLAQIKPADDGYPQYPDLDTSGKVMMDLFQDGVFIGSFEMDGTVDSDWTTISNLGQDVRVMETASYHFEFENLPKYDEGGVYYTYLVLEQAPSGWHTERTYDADTHTTRIENTVGPGEGSEIRLIKNWNDGDDAAHRLPVVVDLVATTSMTAKQNIDPATDELYHYDAGEVVVSNITLSADNSWFAEVDVPIGDVSYKQFRIEEKYLIGDDGTQYPIVSGANNGADAQTAYANKGISTDWINIGWDYKSTENTYRVATEDHVYQVSGTPTATEGEYNDAMSAVTATNRRLGLLDIDITKIWNDGVDHDNRPKAELVLSCTEYTDAFSIDAEGKAWVQVSENRIPVLDAEGEQLTTADSVRIENIDGSQALVMTMELDLTQSKFTYAFHGLPKYDNSGNVVHYDVKERWAPDENAGEYTSTKEVGEYEVGTQHFHDKQAYKFTNTRQATRSVVFHKHWSDQYVNDQLKQRPDIYLTLYRMTVERGVDGTAKYSDPEQVEEYVNWLWTGAQGSADAQYDQTCSIANLPSYDSNGNEYVYFATESMSADGSSLDYTPVTFRDTFTDANGANMDINGDPAAVNIQTKDETDDPASIEDGSNWAIHEGGTFVNKLTDNLVARGTKLWENVPGNVAQADLPELTVYIQQRVAGEDTWPSLKFETDDEGNWKFADGTSAIAWTSDLVSQGNNQYSYRLAYTGENTEEGVTAALDEDSPTLPEGAELLPRYTDDGQLYEYRAIEVPWGLLNEPSGPTTEFINTTDFCELRDSDDDSIGIYVIEHGETGSFLLRNIYTSDTGSLTVQKHYTGREADDLYPATTFDVYRYYINDKGVPSVAALVDSVTLTNDMLKQGAAQTPGLTVTGAGKAATTAQYTFSGLDIYAPDGSYWQYYVVEHNINGYKTTVNVGNVAAENVNGAGEAVDDGVSSGALCPEQGTVEAPEPGGSDAGTATSKVTDTVLAKDNVAADGTVTPDDTTPDVTFKNEYTPESIELTGTKTWDDYNGMFNMRPTVEQFWGGLTVEQIGNNKTINLKDLLQNVTADDSYYYVLDDTAGNNIYKVTISNLPKWAPDGTAYQYKVTEDLSKMDIGNAGLTADNYYDVVTGEATVSASAENPSFALRNALRGSISVHKDWEDGEDPYGLRPTSVTVQLQARLVYQSAGGGTHTIPVDGSWENARQLLLDTEYATEEELQAAGITKDFIVRELRADNGWNASWTGLPMAGISEIPEYAGELFTIEYRAVEIAIGDQEIKAPTADKPGNSGSIYETYHPYQPSQEETGDADNGYRSEITNTLETTSISATKSWAGDINGNTQDAWNTRPDGANSNWEVTYLLQQRLEGSDDEGWHWLMEYGAEQAAVNDPLAAGIVSQTITGNGQSATVEWKNLPDCDENGTKYEYRVVEQVPGGYDVTDESAELVAEAKDTKGTAATTDDVIYRYYVVNSVEGGGAGDSQTFTNTLRTVNLTGTKAWEDFGTGVAPNIADNDYPTMTLYRAYKTGDTTYSQAEQVTYIHNGGQPEWTDADNDGIWEFAYNGLPAANADDKPYVYWAEETSGSAEGFYPLYGSDNVATGAHDAAGTEVTTEAAAGTTGAQINEAITNVATRLSLNKVSNWENDDPLVNIELSVMSTDGKTTYAVWNNGADGKTYTTHTWVNGTTNPDDTTGAVARTDNLIVGLHEGSYIVRETGTVPAGYAKAQDVRFTINANGTATTATGVTTTTADGIHSISVTATDPVLRGHLEFTKYVSDDGKVGGANQAALAGAVFDLYQVNSNGDDLLVASDLATNAQGIITTVNNGTAVSDDFKAKYDNKYTKLSEGLPEGTYYFLEKDATPGAVMPSGDAAKSPEMTITQDTHYAYTSKTVDATMANEDFTAGVKLHKFDTETNEGIQDIAFTLTYDPEGDAFQDWTREVKTGQDGTLELSDLEKGTYTLTEKSTQTGYESNGFSATFIIDNADDDTTFDIKSINDGADINFTVTSADGTFVAGQGIPNVPQRGSVTMAKTGLNNGALNGATFELQRLGEDGQTWEVIAEGLVTGNAYAMNDGNTALEGDAQTTTAGQIKVSNLKWGTYRFVETAPADGYFNYTDSATADNHRVTSGNLTIDRTHLNPTLTGDNAVRNTPTSLEINKANDVGQALAGAQFQIAAQDNSEFAQPSSFAAGTYDEATKTVTLTTDSTGHIELVRQLVVGGTYTIYESKAPSGYDPADAVLTVVVQEDGSLAVDGDLPERYEWADLDRDGHADNAYSFTVTNIHEEIDILKVNHKGDPLQGAEFTLTGVCMDENTMHVYTTDKDGYIHVDAGLMGGVRYELKETKPADGYAQLSESLYFMMDERGEIVVTDAQETPLDKENYPKGYSVKDNRISLTVENDPVELQITKRAPENEDGTPGETLPWAEFTITPVEGSKFAAGANPTEAQTMRTGEDGTLSMSAWLIVGGTYDITETKAPEGYEKVEGTMRVTVDSDGTIRVLGSVQEDGTVNPQAPIGYSRVDENSFEVQVINQPVEISLVKVNVDDTTSILAGGEFQITGTFAGGTEEETRTFTTNADGTLVYNGEALNNMSALFVPGRDYTISETKAPDGFERIEGTWTFQVTEGGELTTNSDQAQASEPGFAIGVDKVTIVASDEPIEVGFVKKDLGDTNLAGAEYTLSGIFVNDKTHETAELDIPFTSTEETVSFAKLTYEDATYSLIAGKEYTLTENTAPAYYETLEPFTFSVDENGKIAAAGGSTQAAEGEEGYVISEADGTIVLTAHDTPIEVTLHKTSSANDQLALSGAIFELYQGESIEDEPYAEIPVGEDGTFEIENLIAGITYTLHEVTAPAGYELLSDVTFTVEKDGTVTLQDAPEGYSVAEGEDGVVTFTAADTPIEAQLAKTDEAGTPLANAIFTVQGTFAGDYANETEITLSATDANGVANIPSAALIANEKYTITEVTAPGGYELAGSVEFAVGTDGVITIVTDDAANADDATAAVTETTAAADSSTTGEGSAAESAAVAGKNGTGIYTASTDGGTAVISATDHLVEVTITKTDGGENLLPGAEFTATGSNNGSAAGHSVTATTGEDGTAVLSGLIAGQEYTLAETKAPAGYELLTDTLTFTVQADGTIDAGFFPPAAFAIGQTKDAVTVTDNPLEVTLVKQAPNGAPLAGAEFRVEGEFPDGQTEKTFTSDENGIVFHQLQLTGSAEGTLYTVTETKVPEGYAQPSGSLDLLVFEDGTVRVADTSATDMKQNASVTESGGVAVITLNNEPLPGTELPQTGDNKILPLLAGAFGLLGLWAIVMGTVAYRRFRTKGEE